MQVPLPSRDLEAGASPMLSAPGGLAMPDVAGRQVQQFGDALTDFGAGVAATATVMQDEIDTARATDAYTKWSDAASGALYHPQDGYLRTEGVNALGERRSKTLRQIEQTWRDLETGLDNEVQRGELRRAVQRHLTGLKERVYGHEAEQLRVYSIGSADAMRRQSARAAFESYADRPLDQDARVDAAAAESLAVGGEAVRGPLIVGESQDPEKPRDEFAFQRNTAVAQANRVADLKGWGRDDPRRAELVRETTTDIHEGVVGQLLAKGFAQQASEYVAGLDPKEVQPEKMTRLASLTREASLQDQSLQFSMWLQGKGASLGQQRAILDEMRKADPNKVTAELYDATRRRIEADDEERFQQRVRASNEVLDDAETWVKANRARPQPIDAMSPEMRLQLRETGNEDKVKLFIAQGGQWITTERGRGALLRATATPTWLRTYKTFDEFRDDYRTDLSPANMQEMAERWGRAHELPAGPAVPDGELNTIIRLALVEKGLLPDPAKEDRAPTREENLRADRLEVAVKQRARSMAGPGGKVSDKLQDAMTAEFGNEITTQAGKKLPLGSLSKVEQETGFHDTAVGIRVFREGVVIDEGTSAQLSREKELEMMAQHDAENVDRVRRGMKPHAEPTWAELAERFAALHLPELRRREAAEAKERKFGPGGNLTREQWRTLKAK